MEKSLLIIVIFVSAVSAQNQNEFFKSDHDLFYFFPLAVGNKWFYSSTFYGDLQAVHYDSKREITGTFRVSDFTYFQFSLSENTFSGFSEFFRVDSTAGKIYRAFFGEDTLQYEELFVDLTISPGDTFRNTPLDEFPMVFENEDTFENFGISSARRNYSGQSSPLHQFSLAKNLGITREYRWELAGTEDIIKGAVIAGIVYGDTTVILEADDKRNRLPSEFRLDQNYPNPFNPFTNISFCISRTSFVNLKIYDILGKEVAVLVSEEKPAGDYEIEFNASGLTSGIYFYKLQAEGFSSAKKMILMK